MSLLVRNVVYHIIPEREIPEHEEKQSFPPSGSSRFFQQTSHVSKDLTVYL